VKDENFGASHSTTKKKTERKKEWGREKKRNKFIENF